MLRLVEAKECVVDRTAAFAPPVGVTAVAEGSVFEVSNATFSPKNANLSEASYAAISDKKLTLLPSDKVLETCIFCPEYCSSVDPSALLASLRTFTRTNLPEVGKLF